MMYLLQCSILSLALLNPTLAAVPTLTNASSSTVSRPTVDFPYTTNSGVINNSTDSSLTNVSLYFENQAAGSEQ